MTDESGNQNNLLVIDSQHTLETPHEDHAPEEYLVNGDEAHQDGHNSHAAQDSVARVGHNKHCHIAGHFNANCSNHGPSSASACDCRQISFQASRQTIEDSKRPSVKFPHSISQVNGITSDSEILSLKALGFEQIPTTSVDGQINKNRASHPTSQLLPSIKVDQTGLEPNGGKGNHDRNAMGTDVNGRNANKYTSAAEVDRAKLLSNMGLVERPEEDGTIVDDSEATLDLDENASVLPHQNHAPLFAHESLTPRDDSPEQGPSRSFSFELPPESEPVIKKRSASSLSIVENSSALDGTPKSKRYEILTMDGSSDCRSVEDHLESQYNDSNSPIGPVSNPRDGSVGDFEDVDSDADANEYEPLLEEEKTEGENDEMYSCDDASTDSQGVRKRRATVDSSQTSASETNEHTEDFEVCFGSFWQRLWEWLRSTFARIFGGV